MNLKSFTSKAYTCLFPVAISMCLLTACYRLGHANNEITKIEVETGACLGPCQLTVTSIDSSLAYRYYGGKVSSRTHRPEDKFKIEGFYTGRVTQQFWDTLNAKLKKIDYQRLNAVYNHTVDDQGLEIIIHYKGKIKHISAQSASLPDSVADTFYWIADSYRRVKPKKSKSPISFEVSSLYPPLPPPQKPAHPRFPPPVVND